MNKKEKIVLLVLCIIALISLILAISFDVRKQDTYESRNKIALYIFKYRELPSNYILVEDNEYSSNKEAIEHGYSFGGMVHRYEGEITKYTKNEDLREADYYPSREKASKEGRGTYRFVYTASGDKEVFYTENHYGDARTNPNEQAFIPLLFPELRSPIIVMWIIYVSSSGWIVIIFAGIQIRNNKKTRKNNYFLNLQPKVAGVEK